MIALDPFAQALLWDLIGLSKLRGLENGRFLAPTHVSGVGYPGTISNRWKSLAGIRSSGRF